jgi:ribosomal protein S18 acetylase RimI-like enzyme
MSNIITKATKKHLVELIELENSLFISDKISDRQMLYNINKQNLFFVCTIDSQVAGYILCFEYKKSIRVYSLAVSRNYQGKGVAKSLLEHLFKHVNKGIYLEVNTTNEIAINLYKKYGFKIHSTIENYYENSDSAYKMILDQFQR